VRGVGAAADACQLHARQQEAAREERQAGSVQRRLRGAGAGPCVASAQAARRTACGGGGHTRAKTRYMQPSHQRCERAQQAAHAAAVIVAAPRAGCSPHEGELRAQRGVTVELRCQMTPS
jgi:hypothetical protein